MLSFAASIALSSAPSSGRATLMAVTMASMFEANLLVATPSLSRWSCDEQTTLESSSVSSSLRDSHAHLLHVHLRFPNRLVVPSQRPVHHGVFDSRGDAFDVVVPCSRDDFLAEMGHGLLHPSRDGGVVLAEHWDGRGQRDLETVLLLSRPNLFATP